MVSQADVRRGEIARERRQRPVSIVALRLAELNRLFTARYGAVLPADDSGRDDVMIVAHHLAWCTGETSRRIAGWIALRAPWMRPDEMQKVIEQATTKPRRWRADSLARRLNLAWTERQRLRITTIGATDVTKDKRTVRRAVRKRIRDRLRAAARRRAAGCTPRSAFIATALTTLKPWAAEGVCRRTWERRRNCIAQHKPSSIVSDERATS